MSRQERKKMQSLRHMNTDEALDRAVERAEKAAEAAKAAKSASKKPLFLWLKPGQTALVRPLCARLSGAVKLMKHDLWNKDREISIANICACELEPAKACLLCETAKDNKKVTAGEWFFLPIFVYQVINADGSIATFEEKQEDGSKVVKEIKNAVRLLELTAFGRKAPLFHYFRKFTNDPDNCLLNGCDFTIEQIGEGTAKNFQPIHKNPKPMHEKIKAVAASVTEQSMYERIIAFCPPKISEDNSDPFEDGPPAKGNSKASDPFDSDTPDGSDPIPGKKAEEVLDDTIMDW